MASVRRVVRRVVRRINCVYREKGGEPVFSPDVVRNGARFSGGRLMKTSLISRTSGIREQILRERTLARRDEARQGEAKQIYCARTYIVPQEQRANTDKEDRTMETEERSPRRRRQRRNILLYRWTWYHRYYEEIRRGNSSCIRGWIRFDSQKNLFHFFSLRRDVDFLGNFGC